MTGENPVSWLAQLVFINLYVYLNNLMNNPSNSPVISEKKMFKYVCCGPNEWPWIKGHRSAWQLVLNINECLIRFNISHKYYDFGFNSYRKMNILRFSPYKCIRNKIWPCHKVGQSQPRFIICAKLVGPTSQMLHTKSKSQWPFGSREEDI